ncbi:MAG: hypothetical protein ACLF0P_01760 [Thermoanaerobaculia bacterium]
MGETVYLIWDSLWAANPLPGRLIVLAVLGVVALAMVQGRRHLARYRREEHQIARVSRHLAEWRAEGAAPADPSDEPEDGEPGGEAVQAGDEETKEVEAGDGSTGDEPGSPAAGASRPRPGLVDIDQLIHAVSPGTLMGDRIRAIAKMRLYRVKVDIDTLQELALYKDAATPGQGYPAFATGLSMMLGILGTFLGLAAMVQEIHLGLPTGTTDLTLESWMSSVEHLGTVLGGMKTAFSTSLVGMAGAILASTIAFRLGRRRRQVFEALERVTAAELIPATVPAVEDELVLAQVSRQLDESFSRLDEIYLQNREALKDLTAAQEAFVAIVDEIRDITRGHAARNIDDVLGQLARSNEAVLDVSRQIPGIVSVFETTARSLRDSAAELQWSPRTAQSGGGGILGLRPAVWVVLFGALVAIFGLARAINAL